MHVGHLWTSGGTLLGSVTFTNETFDGWQQALFATPISITANTTYVVSYFAPQGYNPADIDYFAFSGVDNGPLHALSDFDAGGKGVLAACRQKGYWSVDADKLEATLPLLRGEAAKLTKPQS
jgi:hypothetical protein